MKIILVCLLVLYNCLTTSVYCQENLVPYENFDSLQRISKESFIIESGSYVKGAFFANVIYVIKFDEPLHIMRFSANGYTVVVSRDKEILGKYFKKLTSLSDYKCLMEIRSRDKKWLKTKEFDQYWKYQLVNDSKNGETRTKRPLINDCLPFIVTIKERKIVKKILKHLDCLPSIELFSKN